MTSYSFEKGKYGGPCGCVFPFFQQLPGRVPNNTYMDLVPAGFLRCRGQILNADDYPNLARVIGVGSSCIYKRDNSSLIEPNADGSGGQIQIPDLGSKYITAGAQSGEYSYETVTDANNNSVSRAGVATTLTSAGDQIEFFYDGNFIINANGTSNALRVNGLWRLSAPTRTPSQTLFAQNFLGHGHGSTMAVVRQLRDKTTRKWDRTSGVFCRAADPWPNSSNPEKCQAVWLDMSALDTGSLESTEHQHYNLNARITNQTITRAEIGDSTTTIPASGLVTTVSLNTNNIVKMDDIAPKFILCEYLIKF